MPDADVLLLVEATLTEWAREAWLRRAYEMFPRLRGAKVADVLQMMDADDSFERDVEDWWRAHGHGLAIELVCEPALLSASARVAIVATGASSQHFDALAEVIARAAVASEAGVIDREQVRAEAAPEVLYHGPELDAAIASPANIGGMGVCLTALSSRRDAHIDGQIEEAQKATDVVLGGPAPDGPDGEELAAALRELVTTMQEGLGRDLTSEEATLLALRMVIGGSFSRGIEIGLTLARTRQAKARELEIQWDQDGEPHLEASFGFADTRMTVVEKVKL